METDWDLLQEEVTWLDKGKVLVPQSPAREHFAPAAEFLQKFPKLSALLASSRVTIVQIKKVPHHLYTWPCNGGRCGWLCESPGQSPKAELHPDHLCLIESFGGVRELLFPPSGTWLLNLNWSICASESGFLPDKEIRDYRQYVGETLEAPQCPLLDQLPQYIRFAQEANGNFTAYERKSSEVIMFAPDHCFNHVESAEKCPDYSFYRIKGSPRFMDWVEVVAAQWTRYAKLDPAR